MTIILKKELDIDELYDEIADNFANFDACCAINITESDVTPALLAEVFSELADTAKCLAAK